MNSWLAAVAQYTSSNKTAADKGQLLSAAMVSLNGDTLGYADTMSHTAAAFQQFVTDFDNAKTGVVNLNNGVIDFHNAGAAPLLDDLANLQQQAAASAAATFQMESATKGQDQALKDAADVYQNDTAKALIDNRQQLGLTLPQAQAPRGHVLPLAQGPENAAGAARQG
jgi:hypothetical protein